MKQVFTYKLFLTLFFSTVLCFCAVSQNSPYKLRVGFDDEPKIHAIGIRNGFGVIIPHRESMIHLVTGHIFSTELYIEKCGKGTKRNWNRYYRYPTTGFSFYFAYLANKETLGNAFALDYYSNMHLIKRKRFLFDLRLATGLGYLTKTFNPENNNHNVAIGSKMNISIGASFDMKFKLKNNWQLATGLSLKHFSNGSFSTPNLGINMPVWMIGIKKIITNPNYYREYSKLDSNYIAQLKKQHKKHLKFSATVGIGAKEIYPAGGNRYGTYSLQLNAIYAGNWKSAFSAGLDVIHNVALYKHAYQLDTLTEMKPIQFTQTGFNIGYVQMYDRFELFIQSGIYLLNKYNKDGLFYQRLGGRYYFNKNILVHFALKTHFARADYFEAGLGYFFRKERKERKLNVIPY